MAQETMRVRQEGKFWVVELLSPVHGMWIVQGEHLTKDAADADLQSWK